MQKELYTYVHLAHNCCFSDHFSQANTIEFTVVLSTYPNPFFPPKKTGKALDRAIGTKPCHTSYGISVLSSSRNLNLTQLPFFSVALTDGSALFHFAAAPQSMLFNDFVTLQ